MSRRLALYAQVQRAEVAQMVQLDLTRMRLMQWDRLPIYVNFPWCGSQQVESLATSSWQSVTVTATAPSACLFSVSGVTHRTPIAGTDFADLFCAGRDYFLTTMTAF